MKQVYYTEDDNDIAEGVKTYLEKRDFNVTIIPSVSETKALLLKQIPDIILIDWNLPDGTGDVLCNWIRRRFGNNLPVLFLTVKGETADIVNGFHQGADDYMTKPFELEVLYSRIHAILRRAGSNEATELCCDGICLNQERKTATCEGEEIPLNQAEYKLLFCLMENKGKTVTREILLEYVWDADRNYVNDNTLTVAIKRLRKKAGNPACIKTVRSFGYRMEDTF